MVDFHTDERYRADESYVVSVVRALGAAGCGVDSWQTDLRTDDGGLGAELYWRRRTLVARGAEASWDLHLFWNRSVGWSYRWGPAPGSAEALKLDVDDLAAPAGLVALFGDLVADRDARHPRRPPGAYAGEVRAALDAWQSRQPQSSSRPADFHGGRPATTRRHLVGGPLDGELLDVSALTAEQLRDGVALRATGCAFPDGRSRYVPDPDRPGALVWAGDIPSPAQEDAPGGV
ncbi:hypothetical protein OG871_03845 [Kitasatospora sp. NBC_00374]|uniref:hypothetical protein n=1 Tax=Kitasatospora sp. NBC_00374 TaxID=2975964 RepID=UPI0032514EFD